MEAHFQTLGYCSVLTQSMGTLKLGIGLQIDGMSVCGQKDFLLHVLTVCRGKRTKTKTESLHQPLDLCFLRITTGTTLWIADQFQLCNWINKKPNKRKQIHLEEKLPCLQSRAFI